MVGLSGLEKFSHLEDKIYRTIELTKTLRQEKESMEKELSLMRRDMGSVLNEKERLESQVEKLLAERETIRMKVEAMLDAVAALDPEMAEELRLAHTSARCKAVWKPLAAPPSESRSTIRPITFALMAIRNTLFNWRSLSTAGCERFRLARSRSIRSKWQSSQHCT